jgi:hypothetical protein
MLDCNDAGAAWQLDSGFALLTWKMKIVDQGFEGLTMAQQIS